MRSFFKIGLWSKRIEICSILLLFQSFGLSSAQTDVLDSLWVKTHPDATQVENFGGVTIWKMRSKVSGADYFGAKLQVPQSMLSLLAALEAINQYSDWVPDAIHVQIIAEEGSNAWVFYNATRVRWPFSDRHSLIRMTRKPFLERGWRLDFELAELPEFQWPKGRKQLKSCSGYWLIFPTSDNESWVAHVISIDSGGGIPKSLTRSFIRKIPAINLLALMEWTAANRKSE